MTGRASGAATDPNALGLLCGMAAVVSLACVAARDAARNGVAAGGRRVLAFLAVPAAAGLLLSGSRSGIVVALVGTALLLILPGLPLRRRAALLALVLAAVVAAVLVVPRRPGSALERLRRTADETLTVEDRSSSRTVLWDAALRMFRHDPVAGGGLGAFAWELPNLLRESGRSLPLRDNPGNAYLQALAETGILGFVLTLLFCLAIAREGWIAGAGGEPLARGAGAACLAFLGALAAGSHWFAPDVALYFFLLAAVCARPRPSQPSLRTARPRLAIVAAYAVAASVALVATRSTDEAFRYRPGLGFHAKETGPGGPFWWTQRRFAIRIPAGRSVSLGLAHFTPEGRPVTLTAVSEGREVFERQLVPGEGIRLRLSAGTEPRVVQFALSRAFVPKRLGLSADRRQLGLVAVFP
jgi:O-antigen ligase